jgi:AraC-like DNA-binding protein
MTTAKGSPSATPAATVPGRPAVLHFPLGRIGLTGSHVLGRPGHQLRDYVVGYIGFPPAAPRPRLPPFLPSGTVPLLLEFAPAPRVLADGHQVRFPEQPVIALREHAVPVWPQSAHGLSIVMTPPGAFALFGVALRELANTITGAADLLGHRAPLLAERLAALPDWPARFALLDHELAAWLARGPAPAPAVVRAWRRLHESGGRLRISDLAAEVGTSRRYLEQQFGVQVGLTPKTMARIIRFEGAACLLTAAPRRDLAQLAFASGYSDHAHLDRDFKEFSGCTPTEFLARRLGR